MFGLLKLRSEKFDWALAASRARQVFAGRRRVKLEKIEMYHFMGEGKGCGRYVGRFTLSWVLEIA